MNDLVIRNGLVVNGTGAPGYTADVAITADRITEVVPTGAPRPSARAELDATGCIVTPGFIDAGTHLDAHAVADLDLAGPARHGVTTVVVGTAGVGPTVFGFPGYRGDPLGALAALAPERTDGWRWGSFREYLAALAGRTWSVDVATNVAHSTVRCQVMGARGLDLDAPADDDELAAMCRHLADAVAAGALALSVSRQGTAVDATATIGTDGPAERELLVLATALRNTGRGSVLLASDIATSLDPIVRAREEFLVSKLTALGVPVGLDVPVAARAGTRPREILAQLRAAAQGSATAALLPAAPVGVFMSFRSPAHPFAMTATWRSLAQLAHDERLAQLARPEVRARILAEHAQTPRSSPALDAVITGFSKMYPVTDPFTHHHTKVPSVAAAAAARGVEPAEIAYDFLAANAGAGMLFVPVLGDDPAQLAELVADQDAPLTLSHAGAYPSMMCNDSMPTAALAMWSNTGQVPVERVVNGLTLAVARHSGLFDRGLLAPGFLADVNVIDPTKLACLPPRVTAGDGVVVLDQRARGYTATIKSGRVTVRDDEPTGERPGRLVTGRG